MQRHFRIYSNKYLFANDRPARGNPACVLPLSICSAPPLLFSFYNVKPIDSLATVEQQAVVVIQLTEMFSSGKAENVQAQSSSGTGHWCI